MNRVDMSSVCTLIGIVNDMVQLLELVKKGEEKLGEKGKDNFIVEPSITFHIE